MNRLPVSVPVIAETVQNERRSQLRVHVAKLSQSFVGISRIIAMRIYMNQDDGMAGISFVNETCVIHCSLNIGNRSDLGVGKPSTERVVEPNSYFHATTRPTLSVSRVKNVSLEISLGGNQWIIWLKLNIQTLCSCGRSVSVDEYVWILALVQRLKEDIGIPGIDNSAVLTIVDDGEAMALSDMCMREGGNFGVTIERVGCSGVLRVCSERCGIL